MDFYDYLYEIAEADSLNELDSIVEQAAFDDGITNAEYAGVRDVALQKAQEWRGW